MPRTKRVPEYKALDEATDPINTTLEGRPAHNIEWHIYTRAPSVSDVPLRRSRNSRYIVTGTEVNVHNVVVVLKCMHAVLWKSAN